MNKDFEEFVTKRCEKELLKSSEYISLSAKMEKEKDLEKYKDLSVEMFALIEDICYRAGMCDFIEHRKL